MSNFLPPINSGLSMYLQITTSVNSLEFKKWEIKSSFCYILSGFSDWVREGSSWAWSEDEAAWVACAAARLVFAAIAVAVACVVFDAATSRPRRGAHAFNSC